VCSNGKSPFNVSCAAINSCSTANLTATQCVSPQQQPSNGGKGIFNVILPNLQSGSDSILAINSFGMMMIVFLGTYLF